MPSKGSAGAGHRTCRRRTRPRCSPRGRPANEVASLDVHSECIEIEILLVFPELQLNLGLRVYTLGEDLRWRCRRYACNNRLKLRLMPGDEFAPRGLAVIAHHVAVSDTAPSRRGVPCLRYRCEHGPLATFGGSPAPQRQHNH